jgi:hypothetical protein
MCQITAIRNFRHNVSLCDAHCQLGMKWRLECSARDTFLASEFGEPHKWQYTLLYGKAEELMC